MLFKWCSFVGRAESVFLSAACLIHQTNLIMLTVKDKCEWRCSRKNGILAAKAKLQSIALWFHLSNQSLFDFIWAINRSLISFEQSIALWFHLSNQSLFDLFQLSNQLLFDFIWAINRSLIYFIWDALYYRRELSFVCVIWSDFLVLVERTNCQPNMNLEFGAWLSLNNKSNLKLFFISKFSCMLWIASNYTMYSVEYHVSSLPSLMIKMQSWHEHILCLNA